LARGARADRQHGAGGARDCVAAPLAAQQRLAEQKRIEQQRARLGVGRRQAQTRKQRAYLGKPGRVHARDARSRALVPAREAADRQFHAQALGVGLAGVEIEHRREDVGGRARLGRLGFDRRDARGRPRAERALQQILAILEMPVETALGHGEGAGQAFDAHARHAALRERGERLRDPGGFVEPRAR